MEERASFRSEKHSRQKHVSVGMCVCWAGAMRVGWCHFSFMSYLASLVLRTFFFYSQFRRHSLCPQAFTILKEWRRRWANRTWSLRPIKFFGYCGSLHYCSGGNLQIPRWAALFNTVSRDALKSCHPATESWDREQQTSWSASQCPAVCRRPWLRSLEERPLIRTLFRAYPVSLFLCLFSSSIIISISSIFHLSSSSLYFPFFLNLLLNLTEHTMISNYKH